MSKEELFTLLKDYYQLRSKRQKLAEEHRENSRAETKQEMENLDQRIKALNQIIKHNCRQA